MIEKHVVSRELSERLKNAGFPQDTLFYWAGEILYHQWRKFDPSHVAAPLLTEVLEQLPRWVECKYRRRRSGSSSLANCFDPSSVNTAAKLWLWWKDRRDDDTRV